MADETAGKLEIPTHATPKGAKATKAEATQRVTMLVPLILSGMRTSEIVRYATAPEKNGQGLGWNLSTRQIENYMARATAEIELMASADRKKVLAQALGRLDYLYGRMVAEGDLRGALAVQREVHQLYGFVSARPEFNQAIAVNQTTTAVAASSSSSAPSTRDSFARKIMDIKRRQSIALERPREITPSEPMAIERVE